MHLNRTARRIFRRFLVTAGESLSWDEFAAKMETHQKWLGGEDDGEQCELSGISVTNVGEPIKGMDLQQIKITNSDLDEIQFDNCLLRGAVFNGSSLARAKFTNCDLTDAEFQHTELEQAQFDRCKLMQMDISESGVEELGLHNCAMAGLISHGVEWNSMDILEDEIEIEGENSSTTRKVKGAIQAGDLESSGDYSGSIIVGEAKNMLFHDTLDLSGAEIQAQFRDCTFDGVDMSQANLRKSNFSQCPWIGVNLGYGSSHIWDFCLPVLAHFLPLFFQDQKKPV